MEERRCIEPGCGARVARKATGRPPQRCERHRREHARRRKAHHKAVARARRRGEAASPEAPRCRDCGAPVEPSRGGGRPPERCPEHREAHRKARRRAEYADRQRRRVEAGAAVHTRACEGCGAEIRRIGQAVPPRRCRSCIEARRSAPRICRDCGAQITGPTPIGAGRRCAACHAERAEARRAAQRERQAARRRAPRPCRRCAVLVEPPRQICSGCRAERKPAPATARTCRTEGCTARIDGAGASVRYCAPCRAVRAEQPGRPDTGRAAAEPPEAGRAPAAEAREPRTRAARKAPAPPRRGGAARRGESGAEAASGRGPVKAAGRAAVRRRIEQHRERMDWLDDELAELERAQGARARRLHEAA